MQEMNSIAEIVGALKKRLLLILLLAIGAGVVSAIGSYYLVTPTYQSSSQFLVTKKQETLQDQLMYDYSQINSNIQLINTYNVIIKSPRILDIVSEELGTPVYANTINVSSAEDSQVVTVTAVDSDPNQAMAIANTTVEVFQQEVPKLMRVDNVSILTQATRVQEIGPNPVVNISIAVALGAMLGAGLTLLFEFMDRTIKSEEFIKSALRVPVLGVVSHVDNKLMKEQFNNKGMLSDEKEAV